ncbi:12294_t:CDS:2 [Rhizophagus irregularis]|nr:12294_t:CDS:2 [Rhizophagus irregularis]
MANQSRIRFNQEDDDEIKKYMKVFGHLPNCNTLVICHDPFDEIEKLYMIEWVKKYKIQNPSADKIPWKKLIQEMKDKFGKLRSENKVKNFWHSKKRQKGRNPSGINHDVSYSPQYNNGSEIKRDPKMEISKILN